jgi:hypothetical protein
MESLVVSNSYNPVMLIDPVAQKEIEHHFNVSVDSAVNSSRENAALSMFGINLNAIARDPKTLALLQAISKVTELEQEQARIREEQWQQRMAFLELKSSHDNLLLTQGQGQFYTVLGYAAAFTKMRITATVASSIGKRATAMCKSRGINPGKVNDSRFGLVQIYPKEILDEVFEETKA